MSEAFIKAARSYSIAALFAALAVLIRWLAAPWLGSYFRVTLLYVAVACAVRYGGMAPGLLAAVGGFMATAYLLPLPPAHSVAFIVSPRGVVELLIYTVCCAIIIVLAEGLRRARRRTADDTSALRATEERFRVAVESAALPFAILQSVRDAGGHIVDFKWQYLNSAAARLIRRSAAEVIGTRVAGLFPFSWDVPGLFDTYRSAAETGEPQTLEVHTRPGGVDTWFHSIATRFGDGIAVWFTDVTESRKAELAVRDARTQLQTVTDLSAAGMARCSRDLRYVWVNPQLAEWVGRPVAEIVGQPIRDVIGEEAFRTFLPHYEAVLSGRRVEHEHKVDLPNGDIRWISAVYVPMFEPDGTVDGWVAVMTNITQRKRLELALLDADRRKDEFLAVLAHELRNPLAPMRNALEILHLRTPGEPHLDRARAIIDRQLLHLSRLVDDLLDLSRVTQGRIQLQRTRVAVSVVVAHAVEASTPIVEESGHHLEVSIPSEPIILEGDITRLAQIIGNLLNNAAKYTPPGGRIKVTVAREQDDVRIDVEDTGIGIPEDMLPHIFDMFVQVNPSLDRTQSGLGIGLTLVSRLAAMHGGRVEVRSAGLGKGSTFSVRLPVALDSFGEHLESVEPSAPTPRRRVLIVDDNVDAAESLSMLLNTLGHDTRLAHDGEQALDVVQAFKPDVVLLDIGLPRVNGYEVARRIRRMSLGEGPHLIALTGWGQAEDRRRAKEAGFDHHVTKPVELSVLSGLLASERPPDCAARAVEFS